MIKSIVSGFVALSVLATPVAAQARDRDDYRGERYEHHDNTGSKIAIGLGALILGAAIGSSSRVRDPYYNRGYDPYYNRGYDRGYDYDRSYQYRRPVCRDVVISGQDQYGYYERVVTRCY